VLCAALGGIRFALSAPVRTEIAGAKGIRR